MLARCFEYLSPYYGNMLVDREFNAEKIAKVLYNVIASVAMVFQIIRLWLLICRPSLSFRTML